MKLRFFSNFFLIIIFSLSSGLLNAQEVADEDNVLKKFQEKVSLQEKFHFFFITSNRYKENSPYDWEDTVNVYLDTAKNANDSLAINHYKLILSQIYYNLGEFDHSISTAKELHSYEWSLEKRKILLNIMDHSYSELELYDKQLEVRKEKKELGISKNIAFYDIYSNLGLHRKAMTDYILEVKKTIPEEDFYGKAEYHNKVGNYLRLDKAPTPAITSLKKAKGYIEVFLNDITKQKTEKEILEGNLLKGIIEGNIGKSLALLKQYDEAIPRLESSISIIKENGIGKYNFEVIDNILDLADCHLHVENYKEAKEYLSNDINPIKYNNKLKKNRLLASYFDKITDYKNSVFYLMKNVRMQDSLKSNESLLKKQQLSAVVAQELESSKKTIDEQKIDIELSRRQMEEKDERMNLVFISLIFTLLGFAGLVYAYLKSIKSQRLIAEQNHIIEASLVEKDSLLKEIHHRVKNNLQMVSSLLSLQTKNTRSKAAIVALEEGKSRVKAMALIHQKLYQNDDLSVIEMQGYIESLVNSVQSVYKKGGHNINITIDAEGTELDIDRAIPFGLILNELVSNSFKYAFPDGDENGKIYIHLRKNGEHGFFEYTDNGIGLPEDTDERTNSSMGIRLMNRLVNQLQSTLNIDKSPEGVRFWFDFK